jgi:MaoC dehydratase-like protein
VLSSEVTIGEVHGPFEALLDTDRVARYIDATKGADFADRPGSAVPPVFLAMLAYELQGAAFAAIPSSVLLGAGARVHGEHDLRLRRSLVAGEALVTTTRIAGVRTNRAGSVVIQGFDHRDDRGVLVAEQWWSLFLGGATLLEVGDAAPDHTFPEAARARPRGQVSVEIDAETPRRYAEVSGDWSDHHFDAEAAARSGATAPFLHGLCTLAICGHAVAQTAAGGDPARIRRVAARFAAPALVGHPLAVALFDAGDGEVAFEATCADALVIRHGRAEIAPA